MIKRGVFVLLLKLEKRFGNRGLGRIPGVQLLKRVLLAVMTPKSRVVAQVGGFKMYLMPQDSGVSRELLSAGDYERFAIDLFREAVRPDMVVLDVGANIGYYSLSAAEQTRDGAIIYAFEPEPAVMSLLRDNIKLNGYQRIKPVDQALADKSGTLTLNVDGDNLGRHSVVAAEGVVRRIQIETITMDEFVQREGLKRVDVIKVDVEGAEGMVLLGGMETIAKFGPVIFMEYTPDWLRRAGTEPQTLFARLEALGYQVDLLDMRTRQLQRVDYTHLEHLRQSTQWTFQANLILSRPARP